MANRSIQQKIVKMKRRHRRSRWSTAAVGIPPGWKSSKVKTRERGPGMGALTNFERQRVEPVSPWEEWFWGNFPNKIYTKAEMLSFDQPKADGFRTRELVPRAEVLRRIEELQKDEKRASHLLKIKELFLDCPVDHHICLLPHPLRKVNMHFNARKDVIFFVEINIRRGYIRRSYTYSDIHLAKDIYLRGTIQWLQPIQLDSL